MLNYIGKKAIKATPMTRGEKYAKERALADADNNLWQCEGYARAMLYTA